LAVVLKASDNPSSPESWAARRNGDGAQPHSAEAVKGSQALVASEATSPSGQQVEDQNDHRQYQKQVNQGAGYMEAETQKPENQKNYEDCPEHSHSLAAPRAHESRKTLMRNSQAPASIGN
jgi:hypothetical protein